MDSSQSLSRVCKKQGFLAASGGCLILRGGVGEQVLRKGLVPGLQGREGELHVEREVSGWPPAGPGVPHKVVGPFLFSQLN